MKSWVLNVKEDDEGLYLELTDEILAESGFKIGDVLIWEDNKDGSWTLRKKDE